MKYRLFLFLLLVSVSSLLLSTLMAEKAEFPSPTDRALEHEESESRNQEREAWIEAMHRAAPGVNWENIDARTRWGKALRRFERVRKLPPRRSNGLAMDTVANGQLWGHWREVGSHNQAGRIHLAAFDTATEALYLASAGGHIWKGNIQGSQWEVRNDLYRIASLNFLGIVQTGSGSRLLAASGNNRYGPALYSDDEGLTWQVATGLEGIPRYGWGGVHRGFVAGDSLPQVYLLAQEWNGTAWAGMTVVYRSSDLGASYVPLDTFSGNTGKIDLWAQENEVYVLNQAEIFRLDSTQSFSKVADLPATPPGNVLLTGAIESGATWLYALYRDSGNSHIYRSTDAGQTWSLRGSVGSGTFRRTSFACDPIEPEKVFVGGVDVYRSYNGGQDWTRVSVWSEYYGSPSTRLHADIPAIQPFQDGLGRQFWLISTDGGTYISQDDNVSVLNISLRGLNVGQYYSTYTDEVFTDIIHVGSQDQGYQRGNLDEHNGPRNLNQIISGDYGHLVSGDSGATLWMNYPGFTAYYLNARSGSNKSNWSFIPGMGALWLPPLTEDPMLKTRAYLAGGTLDPTNQPDEAHIIRLDYAPGGITPTELAYDFSNGGNSTISAMAISRLNPSFWFVCTNNGEFYTSGNGGSNWVQAQGFSAPGSHYFYGNKILPSSLQANRIYLAGSGYSNSPVYCSVDAGQTFQTMSNGLPATLVYDIAANPDESLLFAATEVGPYVFVAADSQWYELEGLTGPDQTYWTVEYIPSQHTARFGTYGRGVWDFVTCSGAAPTADAGFLATGSGNTFFFINQSQNSLFYSWDFGDGHKSTDKDAVHTYAMSGIYTVTLVASNYCGSDTLIQQVSFLNTGFEDRFQHGEIILYPNPSSGQFLVRNEGEIFRRVTLQVMDLQGKVIFREEKSQWVPGEVWKLELNVSAGQYVLALSDEAGLLYRRERLVIR